MPRKKIEIDIQKAKEYASLGLNFSQIADALGVSVDTIERRRKDSADFADAIKKGHASAIIHVCDKLMEAIDGGNVTAMIFFLKTRAGWSEKSSIEISNGESYEERQRRANDISNVPTKDLIKMLERHERKRKNRIDLSKIPAEKLIVAYETVFGAIDEQTETAN